MPKQISIDQTAKLYNIMGGNIPLAAVRQDIRGWEGFERRVLTRAAEMSVQDWQKDYRKKLADDYMARAQDYDSRKGFGPESRQDISGGPNAVDELRQIKMNREACATNIFYRAMNEGDWETAKYMTEEYAPLKKIYETERKAKEIEQGFIKLLLDGYEEGIAYQCVAFIKGFVQLLEADINTSGYGSGYYAAGSVARKSNNIFHETSYTKGMNIPAGTVLSNLAPAGKYGHVFAVLKDIGDYVIAVEQAGELAEGDAPYDPAAGIGPKAQGYKWHDNSALYWYNANERYRSYYNEDTKTHMLTMMPGITLIPKSYLEDGRKVNMAVPDEASSQAVAKTVRKLGLGSLNDPKKVEKFNETWWKSLGGQ